MEDQIREAAALHIRSLHSVLYGRQWNVHEDSDLEAASVWLAGEVRAVLGRVITDNDRPLSPKVRDYARRLRRPWVAEAADEPGDEVHWHWGLSSAHTPRTPGTWDASKGYECPGPHTACGCSNAHWDEEEILEPGFGVPE